jgi:hypothetical protein
MIDFERRQVSENRFQGRYISMDIGKDRQLGHLTDSSPSIRDRIFPRSNCAQG